MPRRILRSLAQVARTRDHLRLGQGAARSRIDGLVDDNGPDGDFVQLFGAARFLDCHAHVVFIGHVAYYMPKYASSSLSLPYGASRWRATARAIGRSAGANTSIESISMGALISGLMQT